MHAHVCLFIYCWIRIESNHLFILINCVSTFIRQTTLYLAYMSGVEAEDKVKVEDDEV